MASAELICGAILAIGMPNADYACEHMDNVVLYSTEYNIDPVLLTAMIYAESRWNPVVESRAGACGLTQIIPKWSRKFGYVSCKQLKNNPVLAIRKGAQILSYWIYKYGKGSMKMGLCGYNAGYRCRGKNINKKGTRYTRRVLKMHKKIEQQILRSYR
jgi:soluble lytic murein transglycosylase-like protein